MLFRRQKYILSLLESLPYHPTKIELTKLTFLLGYETNLRRHGSFYDFLPYKFGPFSFTLSKELESLGQEKLITAENNKIRIIESKLVGKATKDVCTHDKQEIQSIIKHYAGVRGKKLIDIVYKKYPWYATRSVTCAKHRTLEFDQNTVFTVGYEGKSIDYFLNLLLKKNVKKIIDVRSNTISRKYGFSRNDLSLFCNKINVKYCGISQLGIPSKLRRNLKTSQDYKNIFHQYETTWLPEVPEYLDALFLKIKEEPSALLCFESNASMCHRGVLAKACAVASGYKVVHI